jgi:hypothetical protein
MAVSEFKGGEAVISDVDDNAQPQGKPVSEPQAQEIVQPESQNYQRITSEVSVITDSSPKSIDRQSDITAPVQDDTLGVVDEPTAPHTLAPSGEKVLRIDGEVVFDTRPESGTGSEVHNGDAEGGLLDVEAMRVNGNEAYK